MKSKGVFTGLMVISMFLRAEEGLLGSRKYGDYEKPQTCQSCHTDIYYQWDQAMMSKSYTHHWDEIEYFDLAVAHAQKVPELKPVVDGCNGCHTTGLSGGRCDPSETAGRFKGQ